MVHDPVFCQLSGALVLELAESPWVDRHPCALILVCHHGSVLSLWGVFESLADDAWVTWYVYNAFERGALGGLQVVPFLELDLLLWQVTVILDVDLFADM